MLKIVFLEDGIYAYASGAPQAVGGAERDQWLLARALSAAGWSTIVGVRKYLKLRERRIIDGVEYVGIGQGQVLLAWYKFLSATRPDWLFWESAYHLWGPLVAIANAVGAQTIFHAACDLDVQPRSALVHRPEWWPLYAWGLSRTSIIFVQHAGQLSALPARWRDKAYSLPKVVLEANGSLLPVKPHSERAKFVAWVGTLMQLKRPDVMIEIARRTPEIRFVVCGGESRDCKKSLLDVLRETPNIEYLGHVAPDKAQEVIANAAVLLCTSDIEGFPNTFVQAWSSGTPVVSLKVDPNSIIERLGLGALAGSVERAIIDITALLSSNERRDEISKRAREFVVKNNSANTVVGLFERALKGGSREDFQ